MTYLGLFVFSGFIAPIIILVGVCSGYFMRLPKAIAVSVIVGPTLWFLYQFALVVHITDNVLDAVGFFAVAAAPTIPAAIAYVIAGHSLRRFVDRRNLMKTSEVTK